MAGTSEILGTYSPENIVIVLSNSKMSHTVSGYADGTFLSISRQAPHATLYTGADLSNARVVRGNKGATVSLTLHQAGESNDVLSALLAADEESRDGTDCFSVTIKDTIGRSMYYSPVAFLGNNPDASFGVDIETREWQLHCVSLTQVTAGNGKVTPDGQEVLGALGVSVDTRWQV